MKRVGLVLDNPKRDLNGLLLLAYHLTGQGHEVFLLPMYQQGYDAPLLALDGIVVNYARPVNYELLRSYRAAGTRVFILDTEGGLLAKEGANSPQGWVERANRDGLHEFIDHYLFWGSALYEAFRADSGFASERLHLTGCPRYDFCAEPWVKVFPRRPEPYVLINANFPVVNPLFSGGKAGEMRAFRGAGWSEEYAERLYNELHAAFGRYLEALKGLIAANPALKFLIRPHPFEQHAPYRAAFAGCGNVTVDGDGDVLGVIANASTVVHMNCGTAVETNMLGKVPVSLEFANSAVWREHGPLPSKISLPSASLEEAIEYVRAPARAAAAYPGEALHREYIEPYYYRRDGQAAARAAAVIGAALDDARPSRSFGRALRGSRAGFNAGRLLQGVIATTLGSRAAARLRQRHKPELSKKYVGADAVAAALSAIAAADGHPGSRFAVDHARMPVSGRPMASLRIARH